MKSQRNYLLLLAGQFVSAFGDNFLLAAILSPLTFEQAAGRITEQHVNAENATFSAVFFFPFILLAPLAGFLNDRFPKTSWLVGGNLCKLIGTAVGFAAIGGLAPGSVHGWQVTGYAIVGIGACLYSPAKYGILPEIVPKERLVKANGAVEMLTLVAILGGLGGGAVLFDHLRSLPVCYGASLGLFALALGLNAGMSRTPCDPAASLGRSATEFGRSLRDLLGHPRLGRILAGSGLFWFAGATMRNNLQGWGLEVFRTAGVADVTNTKLVLLKVGLVLGIVAGTVLAGWLHATGDLSWTRRYGFGLAAGILALGVVGGRWGVAPVVAILVAAGVSAGLLLIPLNAALQSECDRSRLGRVVSIQNFVDYVSMLVGAGFLAALTAFNLAPTQVFIALAVALGAVSLLLRLGVRLRPGAIDADARVGAAAEGGPGTASKAEGAEGRAETR